LNPIFVPKPPCIVMMTSVLSARRWAILHHYTPLPPFTPILAAFPQQDAVKVRRPALDVKFPHRLLFLTEPEIGYNI
jgi:hypothetical protein